MIPRYAPKEMAALFSDEARFAMWLRVELLATDGWVEVGDVPAEAAAFCRDHAPVVDAAFVDEVAERERITDHDVAAFVDVVQEAIGQPEGSWIHYGLTSSDVVDTALCATLTRAADLLVEAAGGLVRACKARALDAIDIPVTGRTHGMHAEPTTFGAKFALWALQADRDVQRLRAARDRVAVGKLSGAVGTFSNIDPRVEAHVCSALGLVPVPATQVVARDRHAEFLWACASVGATIELIATEIRHMARSELGEVEEPFKPGQKGSSAMPHKRNPILSERLCGLARVLRGYLSAGLEDVALWHERDISHSSVERVVLPDASMLTLYMLQKTTGLVEGLVLHPERALATLTEGSHGLVFSQSVLLALVSGGLSRDAAYRIVQRDAREAWEEGRSFRAVLDADPEVTLSAAELDAAFDLSRTLRHVHRFTDALEELDPMTPSPLPLLSSGKVRELYDAGDGRLLMVASDRISAFDVIMDEPIPEKGRVLTAMTAAWLEELADLAPNHLISADTADFPEGAAALPGGLDYLAGRSMLVHRAEMLDIECIVRGYLAGSAYKEYEREGTVHGMAMPAGLLHAAGPARAHLHPVDQGHRGPRPQHRDGRGHGHRGQGGGGGRRRTVPGRLLTGRRPGRGAGHRDLRHQVRTRLHRRQAVAVRRGAHPGLVPVLAGRRLRTGNQPAVVRQAAAARLAGGPAVGQAAATAGAAVRDRRGHLEPVRGGLRTGLRSVAGRLVRCLTWPPPVSSRCRSRCSCVTASPIPRGRRSNGRCRPSASTG